MARWNVVGAQGSLLSHLVNPVYFHSVCLKLFAYSLLINNNVDIISGGDWESFTSEKCS